MSVTVTLTVELPEWWGADRAWDVGGAKYVKELIEEDVFAFVEDARWSITKSGEPSADLLPVRKK